MAIGIFYDSDSVFYFNKGKITDTETGAVYFTERQNCGISSVPHSEWYLYDIEIDLSEILAIPTGDCGAVSINIPGAMPTWLWNFLKELFPLIGIKSVLDRKSVV